MLIHWRRSGPSLRPIRSGRRDHLAADPLGGAVDHLAVDLSAVTSDNAPTDVGPPSPLASPPIPASARQRQWGWSRWTGWNCRPRARRPTGLSCLWWRRKRPKDHNRMLLEAVLHPVVGERCCHHVHQHRHNSLHARCTNHAVFHHVLFFWIRSNCVHTAYLDADPVTLPPQASCVAAWPAR